MSGNLRALVGLLSGETPAPVPAWLSSWLSTEQPPVPEAPSTTAPVQARPQTLAELHEMLRSLPAEPEAASTRLDLTAPPPAFARADPKVLQPGPAAPARPALLKETLKEDPYFRPAADLTRGLTVGATDETDSTAAQVGELIQTGIPTVKGAVLGLKGLPLLAGGMMGGLKAVGAEVDDVVRGLYSRVDEALKLIPAKGAHPNKVKSLLQSNASAEELAYRQVPEFLAGKGNATVTPTELAAHLAAHPAPMPKVKTLGAPTPSNEAQAHLATATDALKAYLVEQRAFSPSAVNDYILDVARNELSPAQIRAAQSDPEQWRLMTDVFDRYKHRGTIPEPPTPTKYGSYQVPGGDNYRETLSTLPQQPNNPYEAFIAQMDRKYGEGYDTDVLTPDERTMQSMLWERSQRGPGAMTEGTFRSGHFDEPNILVHTRSNERTLPTGEPGRFVEEVQSDWHQTGKEEGYRLPPLTADDVEVRHVPNEAIPSDAYWETYDRRTGDLIARHPGRHTQEKVLQDALEVGPQGQHSAVPDAPFKESWPDLGLKQQVLEAADDPNAQWLGFTGGETQAARYDLSKKFSAIHWSGTNLKAYDLDGDTVINQTGVTADNLKKYLGRAGAKALLAQPQQGTLRSLVGNELNFGGEGMRHFYDNLLPKRLEKILKPFGGTVERAPLGARTKAQIDAEIDALHVNPPSGNAYGEEISRLTAERNAAPDADAWIARLTPEMKERIRREGLPLLSLLGLVGASQAPQDNKEGLAR